MIERSTSLTGVSMIVYLGPQENIHESTENFVGHLTLKGQNFGVDYLN